MRTLCSQYFGISWRQLSEQQLVQKIIQAVTCELRDAVNDFYDKQQRQHLFIDAWGAQLTLTLTIEEKSELNPTALWTPNTIFSLFRAADVSADATRTDTINSFHTIQ
jgi:predicted RNA-binding Zn ribbon-like protein